MGDMWSSAAELAGAGIAFEQHDPVGALQRAEARSGGLLDDDGEGR
jgi:hypothetical protein